MPQVGIEPTTYGFSACIAGEKAGAAILSATAALESGTGLSTIVDTDFSNLSVYKLDPSLMVSQTFPTTASAFVIGNGLGNANENPKIADFLKGFEEHIMSLLSKGKAVSVVFDADIFYWSGFSSLLNRLDSQNNIKIILTPHAKELAVLANCLELSTKTLSPSQALADRIEIGKAFTSKYKNSALIMKGAYTYSAVDKKIVITAFGGPCLSKAGSGDVFAGINLALLGQGYSLFDACITSCGMLGMAAESFGKDRFDLTALKLCRELGSIWDN